MNSEKATQIKTSYELKVNTLEKVKWEGVGEFK